MKLRNLFLVISILSIQAVTAQTKPVLKARENFANGIRHRNESFLDTRAL